MKTNIFNSTLFLLSSLGMNRAFYSPPLVSHLRGGISNCELTDSVQLFASKKRKSVEDLVVDGLIDTTKKLLSYDDSTGTNRNHHRTIKSFQPKTPNQQSFVDLMRDDTVDIVIAIGPAGTGKTMLACYAAVESLRLKKVNKIVVTRPVVSVDEEIGYLPGDIDSKMDPWTRPIFDTLKETYSAKEIERMMEESIIEIVPLGFMRGRTFKNAWIIADEMQNSSPTQMFMLATRIGEGSKMIITGDLHQSDLSYSNNGLKQIYEKVVNKNTFDCVRHVVLEKEDVQRSRAAKAILDIYEQKPVEWGSSAKDIANNESVVESTESVVESTESVVESTDVEWVNLNNDAALIPLKHTKGNMRKP